MTANLHPDYAVCSSVEAMEDYAAALKSNDKATSSRMWGRECFPGKNVGRYVKALDFVNGWVKIYSVSDGTVAWCNEGQLTGWRRTF